jgi:predicted DNA-binding protein
MTATTVMQARVPLDLMQGLEFLAKVTDRTKSSIIYKAVQDYVREATEDYEDGMEALKREANPNRKLCTWDEITAMVEKERNV